MTRTFDPIELELLWRRLISAVDEAAVAMVRTSFSTLVRESYDFSCVITDETGQSLVQASESIPSFIGTLPGDGEALPALLPAGQARARRRADHQRHLARHRPSAGHHAGQADLQGRQADRLQRDDGARPGHRRQDPQPRAARGVRGGAADPADEDDRGGPDRRDAGRHHPQERAHARADDGRPLRADRGARRDGRPAARC